MKADLNKSTAENVVTLLDRLCKHREPKEWESTLYEVAKRELEATQEAARTPSNGVHSRSGRSS